MNGQEYVSMPGAEGFAKSLARRQYKFIALLPDSGTDVYDLAASLTGETLRAALDGIRTTYEADMILKVFLPAFSFDYTRDQLGDLISSLGAPAAFTDAADFSEMLTGEQAHIGKVVHKTHIDLDAKGVKAAAATMTEMENAVMHGKTEKYLTFNRPFLFLIVDTEYCLPLFIGIVADIGD